MKPFRYERHERGITKVYLNERGQPYCWEPMSWNGIVDYLDWLIETIDDEDLNRWSSVELRDKTLAILKKSKQRYIQRVN